jgi:hypothetical protein
LPLIIAQIFNSNYRMKEPKIGLQKGINLRTYEIARNMLNLHMSISQQEILQECDLQKFDV